MFNDVKTMNELALIYQVLRDKVTQALKKLSFKPLRVNLMGEGAKDLQKRFTVIYPHSQINFLEKLIDYEKITPKKVPRELIIINFTLAKDGVPENLAKFIEKIISPNKLIVITTLSHRASLHLMQGFAREHKTSQHLLTNLEVEQLIEDNPHIQAKLLRGRFYSPVNKQDVLDYFVYIVASKELDLEELFIEHAQLTAEDVEAAKKSIEMDQEDHEEAEEKEEEGEEIEAEDEQEEAETETESEESDEELEASESEEDEEKEVEDEEEGETENDAESESEDETETEQDAEAEVETESEPDEESESEDETESEDEDETEEEEESETETESEPEEEGVENKEVEVEQEAHEDTEEKKEADEESEGEQEVEEHETEPEEESEKEQAQPQPEVEQQIIDGLQQSLQHSAKQIDTLKQQLQEKEQAIESYQHDNKIENIENDHPLLQDKQKISKAYAATVTRHQSLVDAFAKTLTPATEDNYHQLLKQHKTFLEAHQSTMQPMEKPEEGDAIAPTPQPEE